MSDAFDPDERFSLYPMTGEEVLQRLLGVEDADGPDEEPSPEEG